MKDYIVIEDSPIGLNMIDQADSYDAAQDIIDQLTSPKDGRVNVCDYYIYKIV